jgi:hypothetical protein
MKNSGLVAITAALAVSSCGSLDCKPRTVTLTGNLSQDLLGSWDSWGVDSRVVATFRADGGLGMVEEPNQYAPTGNIGTQSYAVLADGGVLMNSVVYAATFNGDALVLQEDGGMARTHPALTCKGKGFD